MAFLTRLMAVIFLGIFPLGLMAAPQPVTLGPIGHMQAQLEVVQPDGSEVVYTPAELEQFPTYTLQTTTPWREEAADFEGVLLADLLVANRLADAAAILVTAENGFTATIPRKVWENVDVMVATRVDGRPHSRRARGPIQFVINESDYLSVNGVTEQHLVWMAARIEVAD